MLSVLTEAAPEAVRLCVVLGTADRKTLGHCVERLRLRGHRIDGLRPWGFRLVKSGHE